MIFGTVYGGGVLVNGVFAGLAFALDSSGSRVSGFSTYARMSAAAQGAYNAEAMVSLTDNVGVIVGLLGDGANPASTYDGARIGNIVVVNKTTGARI